MGEKSLNETTGLATYSLANSSHTVQKIESIAVEYALALFPIPIASSLLFSRDFRGGLSMLMA